MLLTRNSSVTPGTLIVWLNLRMNVLAINGVIRVLKSWFKTLGLANTLVCSLDNVPACIQLSWTAFYCWIYWVWSILSNSVLVVGPRNTLLTWALVAWNADSAQTVITELERGLVRLAMFLAGGVHATTAAELGWIKLALESGMLGTVEVGIRPYSGH